MTQTKTDAGSNTGSKMPQSSAQLILTSRGSTICFGCKRRKKLGLVVCWRCYDTGRPAPVIVESRAVPGTSDPTSLSEKSLPSSSESASSDPE